MRKAARYPIRTAQRRICPSVETQQLLCPRTPVHLVCADSGLYAKQLPRRGGDRAIGSGLLRLGTSLLALGGVDLVSEVASAGADGDENATDRAPVCAALASLQAADERRIDLQPLRDMFLRHPGLPAQSA
jgi:hypothetical protein